MCFYVYTFWGEKGQGIGSEFGVCVCIYVRGGGELVRLCLYLSNYLLCCDVHV